MMRTLKLVGAALALFVVLPVTIVVVLEIAFSPFVPTARAAEPAVFLQADDFTIN